MGETALDGNVIGACKVCEYFVGDADGAIRLFDFDHVDSPFLNSSDILYNNR